ncbi:hypothetical protein SBOR_0661 [Sclerotinia borealis F-4128]|uniref:BD-FAE-like domain-containing protein n=1 Tax=Sclerotinia borealis (strain F-4128) TaxID=1432307 RepID=W9CSA9_SCLBF|nr:hypothetical protein SBOR_0661 [Sclerotinia borealis F-4128]
MEELKNLSLTTGTKIMDIILPTMQIMAPYLIQNRTAILSVPRSTHTYGTHARQTLDLYSSASSSPSPILIFFYGGGLTRGDKILSNSFLDNLVYHNLGSFFAQKGITTIIPDYRRVDSDTGGEGAVYPSGAEDISAVLQWLSKTDILDGIGNKKNVYLGGSSAGGLHIATYLLEPRFLAERKAWQGDSSSVTLKGAVEVGVPFHFNEASEGRKEMLHRYYGRDEDVKTKCPCGLLRATRKSREELGVPKLLVMSSEWDPVDEILNSNEDFVRLAEEVWGEKIEVVRLEGHNHISPPLALNSGEGEEWGERVVGWIKGTA